MTAANAVLGCTWLGDNVMALPTVRALTETWESTVWLLPAAQCDLFAAGAGIETIPLPRASGERRHLLTGFRRIFILPNSHRTAWETWRAGVPERIGYITEGRGMWLTEACPKPVRHIHQVEDYRALLNLIGLRAELGQPRLDLPSDSPPTPVGFYIGWSNTPTKAWPASKWARLAKELALRNLTPTLLAGPGEEEKARDVTERSGLDLPLLGPRFSLLELARTMRGFDVVIGHDTGPLHVSAACGTPTLVLFGSTDPHRTAPLGPVEVIGDRPSCSPCFLDSCPYSHQCMESIPVWRVLQRILRILEKDG